MQRMQLFMFTSIYIECTLYVLCTVNEPLQRRCMYDPYPYGMEHVHVFGVYARTIAHKHTLAFCVCAFLPLFLCCVNTIPTLRQFSDSIIYRMGFFSITQGSSSASNLPLFCITKLELSEKITASVGEEGGRRKEEASCALSVLLFLYNCRHSMKIF